MSYRNKRTQERSPRIRRALLAATALIGLVVGVVADPSPAAAATVEWRLDGVSASGGRTISGTFTYDVDTDTYSNVNITMTEGANTVQFDHAIRPDISDASTIIVGQEPEGADQTGNRIVRIRYLTPLTNAGGTAEVNTTSPNSFVGTCADEGCVQGVVINGIINGGLVTTGQRWFIQGARIGGASRTVQGSFIYDANTNTYAGVNFTSQGFPQSPIVFTESIRPDLDSVTSGHFGQVPEGSDQTGSHITRITFQSPLTNAGGTIPINTVSTNSFIGECTDAECVFGIRVFGLYTQGQVTTNPLQAPSFTSSSPVQADENVTLVADVEATDDFDSEGSGLTYTLGGTDAGLFTIGSSNGQISFVTPADFENPGDSGNDNNYDVIVTVTDQDGLSSNLSLQIQIQDANEDPTLADIADQSVDEGGSLSIPIGGTDPEGPSGLGLSTSGLPSFCSLTDNGDGTGSIVCNPGFGDAGTSSVTVTLTDLGGRQDSDSFNLTVTDRNRPPALDVIADQSVDENSSISIPLSATDPDGDNLTLGASAPSFCSVTDNGDGTGSIDCAPILGQDGIYLITATATDNGNPPAQDERAFTLTVERINRAPNLAAIPDQSVDEGASILIPLDGDDPNADPLSYSSTGLPAFCTLTGDGSGTGSIACNPGFADAGTYPISVILTDAGVPELSTSEEFTLTVANVNRAPQISPVDPQSGDEGQSFVIPVSASDPDGDNLTLGASTPAFCSLTDNGDGTGSITCNPGFDDAGDYEFELSAEDDGNPLLGSAIAVQLTVNNVNRAPTLDVIADQSVDEGQTLSIPVGASDPDGDNLTLSAPGLPSFCSLTDNGDGTGMIDCAPGFLDSGLYPISVIVVDDGVPNLDDTINFNLTVVEINDPPVVEAGPNGSVTVPDAAPLNGSANDDGNPNPPGALTFQWSVVSGSGDVFFADETAPTTTVVFHGEGDFVLRLTASDGQLTGFDDVTITVNNPLGCTIFGTNGPDDLVGTSGDDTICGFDGDDDINAGLGDDTVFGGAGNDKLIGGGGNDVMSATSGTNTFDGQGGNDTMTGGGGPDTMDGGGGSDIMVGNGGNDLLRGGSGGDTITGGAGNDELRGGSGRDKLRDAAGDDMLFGEGGNDTLRDLVGVNVLDGGAGNNRCTDQTGTYSC